MFIAFTFTRVAVLVRRWFEIGPDATMEHGARVEVRLLDPQPHRGTESAAQRTVVDGAVWRADLFNRLDRPADSWSAAHFHPHFDGDEPSERVWSAELTADPWAWLTAQLHALDDVFTAAGHDAEVVVPDLGAVRAFVPQIVASAQQFGPEVELTRDQEFDLTRDAAERIRRMLTLIPEKVAVDREYLRPWLDEPA